MLQNDVGVKISYWLFSSSMCSLIFTPFSSLLFCSVFHSLPLHLSPILNSFVVTQKRRQVITVNRGSFYILSPKTISPFCFSPLCSILLSLFSSFSLFLSLKLSVVIFKPSLISWHSETTHLKNVDILYIDFSYFSSALVWLDSLCGAVRGLGPFLQLLCSSALEQALCWLTASHLMDSQRPLHPSI